MIEAGRQAGGRRNASLLRARAGVMWRLTSEGSSR
jgi:hypothetical protein